MMNFKKIIALGFALGLSVVNSAFGMHGSNDAYDKLMEIVRGTSTLRPTALPYSGPATRVGAPAAAAAAESGSVSTPSLVVVPDLDALAERLGRLEACWSVVRENLAQTTAQTVDWVSKASTFSESSDERSRRLEELNQRNGEPINKLFGIDQTPPRTTSRAEQERYLRQLRGAITNGNVDIVAYILKFNLVGDLLNAPNEQGRTPFDMALNKAVVSNDARNDERIVHVFILYEACSRFDDPVYLSYIYEPFTDNLVDLVYSGDRNLGLLRDRLLKLTGLSFDDNEIIGFVQNLFD